MTLVRVRIDRLDLSLPVVEDMVDLLDVDERARAARFHHAVHRRRFIVRRARLRQWVGALTGVAPAAVRYTIGPGGKPHVIGGPHISASHSGEVMAVAFADDPVGCDIEATDPAIAWRDIAARFFSPDERKALDRVDDATGYLAFYRCWTRKEAYLKALGIGLAAPLDGFTVTTGLEAALLSAAPGWGMADVNAGTGLAAAIVARGDGIAVAVTGALR